MWTRRQVLKTAAVGTPLLLAARSTGTPVAAQDSAPSPRRSPFGRELRRPSPATRLNRPDATAEEWALAWEIYYEAAAPESARAPGSCHCINDVITVWPRLIPEQDAQKFKPTADVDYYQILMEEVSGVEILAGLSTTIWAYFDHPFALTAPVAGTREAPGPTIVGERGRAVIVRFVNRLREDSAIAKGSPPDTCIHGHGCHTPPQSDGYPTDCIPAWSGEGRPHTRVYVHPNDNEFPATLWYHDHTNHHTSRNVYHGLAGFFILRPHPTEMGRDKVFREIEGCLPSGDCDVPIVFQDRLFNPDGSLNFPDFNHDGVLGDTFLVNGRVQPYLKVEPRKYRFRWLNGSNARVYGLAFSKRPQSARTPLPFLQIGSEGGLLPKPAPRTIDEIAMAERHDVVFDFAGYRQQGITQLYLVNCLPQEDGRKPDDEFDLDNCTPLVRFDIGDTVTGGIDPSSVPAVLNHELVRDANGDWACPGFSERDVPRDARGRPQERLFEFDRSHGMWTINGEIFSAHRNDTPGGVRLWKAGEKSHPEIWKVVNKAGGWVHPVHIHLEQFKILDRSDSDTGVRRPPEAHEAGLKDVFYLRGNETVRVIATFKDLNNHFDNTPGVLQDYVFHCHNIDHEDMDMMATNRMYTGAAPPRNPPLCDERES
jgi:FtsP/CotA-like multicopper oxidase with cupredoxin domain